MEAFGFFGNGDGCDMTLVINLRKKSVNLIILLLINGWPFVDGGVGIHCSWSVVGLKHE